MSLNPVIPGDSSIVAAGGVENMSQYPYVIRDARFGIPFGTVPPVSIFYIIGKMKIPQLL